MKLSMSLINQATKKLHQWFLRTPIEYSKPLSDLLKVPVIFKCEYLQPAGSFKLRGAYVALSALTHTQRQQGVATCCIGNHALAVAYVAHLLDIPCRIYAHKTILPFHQKKIIALGAQLSLSPYKLLHETHLWALSHSARCLTHFIPSSDDPLIIAANGGSLAFEITKDVPQVRHVILPVGEGDMLAGLSYFLKKKYPEIHLIGCEHERSAALTSSLKQRQVVSPLPPVDTLAHELIGGLSSSVFSVIRHRIDHVSVHSEEEILEGMRWMLHHHQCLIDPSSAIVIAACLSSTLPALDGPTAVVLSGKNTSPDILEHVLARDYSRY